MIKKIFFIAFIFVIMFWIFIAGTRILLYLSHMVMNDLPLARKGAYMDPEYRAMQELVREKISNRNEDTFIFSTNDGRKFFLVRYFSYPKKVYWLEEGRAPENVNAVIVKE